MGAEWKPGDVVSAYIPTRSRRHQAVYVGGKDWPWRLLDSDGVDGEADCIGLTNVKDVRPLLVIDPEDREQVDRLAEAASDEFQRLHPAISYNAPVLDDDDDTDVMQAALRSLLTPPRPEAYSHIVMDASAPTKESICGKIWQPGPEVTVVGKCPECVSIVSDPEWTS